MDWFGKDAAPSAKWGAQAEPAAAPTQPLLQISRRILAVLDEEQQLLSHRNVDDYERIVARKDHLLLEAVRLSQQAGGIGPDDETRRNLAAVSKALSANAMLIRRHIDAVSGLATLVAQLCRQAESDGTYSGEAIRARSQQ